MNILVSEDIRTVCPEFVGAALEAHITNTPYSAPLWEEIKAFQTDYCRKYTTESIKEMPPIQATRAVYKRCGKRPKPLPPFVGSLGTPHAAGIGLIPNRYGCGFNQSGFHCLRLLHRRIRCREIVGDTLVLGIGREGEAYEGIGRGPLNIAGLPVYRDNQGGIGTPTSDHERTKLTLSTTHLLALVNGYDGNRETSAGLCRVHAGVVKRNMPVQDGGKHHTLLSFWKGEKRNGWSVIRNGLLFFEKRAHR